jgi:uncharacterized protein (TIGR00730 family)
MLNIGSLCVFCGSAKGVDPRHQEAAARLGAQLASRGVTLVYGGGDIGIMGAVADAALEAGGKVIGVIPEHLVSMEVAHRGVSELIVVDSMHSRKRRMFDLSDAFCILPGGLGTLDETFEILTWKQLRLHDKPVIIVNEGGYWGPLLAMIEHMVSNGYARPENLRLFSVVESVDDVLAAAEAMAKATLSGETEKF